jgi:hypothetical protein
MGRGYHPRQVPQALVQTLASPLIKGYDALVKQSRKAREER